jgi:DNA gyrase subunit B
VDKKDNGKKNSAKDVDLVEFFETHELEKEIFKLEKFKMKIEDYERKIPTDDKEKVKPLYSITDGKDEEALFSVREILETVIESGRKGMTITRYKGLGEMNPIQLWETTMDPERRTVLKVILNDVVEADKTFTVLMGDQVEPRREFIERYAREVRDLDV